MMLQMVESVKSDPNERFCHQNICFEGGGPGFRQQSDRSVLEFPINVRFGFVEVLRASCPESADPKMEIIYCTVKRINGSNESVVLCIYFVYLSCVIVYKMLFTRWLFTGLTNGRCKRFYEILALHP